MALVTNQHVWMQIAIEKAAAEAAREAVKEAARQDFADKLRRHVETLTGDERERALAILSQLGR